MNELKQAISGNKLGEEWILKGNSGQKTNVQRTMEINPEINSLEQIADLICIFSKTPLWSNILQSQFKRLGFKTSVCFPDFTSMLTYIMHGIRDDSLGKYALAVGNPDIAEFLIPWENMKRQVMDDKIRVLLEGIPVFFMMEHWKDVDPLLAKAYGKRCILVYNDTIYTNQRKVIQVLKSMEDKRSVEN